MDLIGKNILLISPEPWNHIFVSKHHYAIHLGKRNNKVFFLNPPSFKDEVLKADYENVWQVNYTGFPRGLRFFPVFIQKGVIKKVFVKLQNLCKVKFDVIWSFDNSVFFDFSALPEEVTKISHIVDLDQDFQTRRAAESANVCFGVCKPIVDKLKFYNPNTHFVNHGFRPFLDKGKYEIKIPGKNSVKAFYAGNLNRKYFDWNLIKKIIKENSEVDFLIAGPWSDTVLKEQLIALPNVFYLGKLDAKFLGAYYKLADLLLIVYKADEFHDILSNTHKMMEYLGSGKMIVATHTEECKSLANNGLFLMSDKSKEYPELFKSAIQDLEYWNSPAKVQRRKAFALDNTYDKQIDRIESFLNERPS